jgi:hypothetical protein
VSPRLALSYRPSAQPALHFRVAYGLFFGAPILGPAFTAQAFKTGLKVVVLPFPRSIEPFALPGHRYPESDQVPPNVAFVPQLSQAFTFEPHLRDGYTQQAVAGLDYLIGGKTEVGAGYSFARGTKLFAQRNINPVVRPVPGDPVTSLITGRLDPTQGTILELESGFDSYYHGLTLWINRRMAGRFGFFAHYTFSKAIDNYVDARSEVQRPNDSLRPREERGLSIQDVRHRFVVSGIWALSYSHHPLLRDFELSTIVTALSGRPYNLYHAGGRQR